jgi:hypothetical protein
MEQAFYSQLDEFDPHDEGGWVAFGRQRFRIRSGQRPILGGADRSKT